MIIFAVSRAALILKVVMYQSLSMWLTSLVSRCTEPSPKCVTVTSLRQTV